MNAINENIYTNGRYEVTNPSWFSEDSNWKALAIHRLLSKNSFNPSTISDIGCGTGDILLKLAEYRTDVIQFSGYDISTFAIEKARKNETNRVRFYLGDLSSANSRHVDLLMAIDIIEHVPDYIGFLENIRNQSSHFIFHVPLDLSCRTLLKPSVILQQRKDVGHIHYFSEEHVHWLLADTGFSVLDEAYTFSETDRNKPTSVKSYLKKYARKFSFFISKKYSVKLWGGYSLLIFCTRNE